MMEPPIQYAKTSDGVKIAFSTLGEGTPFLMMPPLPWSHLQLQWQVPAFRAVLERRAARHKVVRYDPRGTGLSERGDSGYSLDALLLDLEAVVDQLALEPFALTAMSTAGILAIAYAARHPERVSHLALIDSFPRGQDRLRRPHLEALVGLADKDWELFTEAQAHLVFGWSGTDSARRFAVFLRDSVPPATVREFTAAAETFDVTDLLPQVKCPTLVVHLAGSPMDAARALVSGIPNARLVVTEPGAAPFEATAAAHFPDIIEDFLDEGKETAVSYSLPGAFRTILFTDIEGSTALTQRLGDAGAQALLRVHNLAVREALKSCGGSEIKHTGDGIMASFPSVSGALECAIAIQRAVGEKAETPFRVRMGLNAGEPVAEEADLFGTAVQLARRICDQAEGGQILVSNVVRELVSGKGFLFADTGEVALKGFEDPVRLYEVRWREDA